MELFETVSALVALVTTGLFATLTCQFLALDLGHFGRWPSAILLLLVAFFFPSTVCLIRRIPARDDGLATMNLLLGLLIAAFFGLMWVIVGEEADHAVAMLLGVVMWGLLVFYPHDEASRQGNPRDARP